MGVGIVQVASVLGHNTRWRMVEALAREDLTAQGLRRALGGEKCDGTYWHHLNKLRDVGVVKAKMKTRPLGRKGGPNLRLKLDKEVLRELLAKMAVELNL